MSAATATATATVVKDLRGSLERIFADAREDYMLPKAYEIDVARQCLKFGYTEQEVKCTLNWISVFGTIECCPIVDSDHRSAIEELIPPAPASEWARHDEWMWCATGREELRA